MSESIEHLKWMIENIPEEKGKRNRWLGFIQGVLWCIGEKSIDELRKEVRENKALSMAKESVKKVLTEIGEDRDDINLVYCATNSNNSEKTIDIIEFVINKGNVPLHPFQAMPYNYYEGGKVGRKRTIEACKQVVKVCDEMWVFGKPSKGVKKEIIVAKEEKIPIKRFNISDID